MSHRVAPDCKDRSCVVMSSVFIDPSTSCCLYMTPRLRSVTAVMKRDNNPQLARSRDNLNTSRLPKYATCPVPKESSMPDMRLAISHDQVMKDLGDFFEILWTATSHKDPSPSWATLFGYCEMVSAFSTGGKRLGHPAFLYEQKPGSAHMRSINTSFYSFLNSVNSPPRWLNRGLITSAPHSYFLSPPQSLFRPLPTHYAVLLSLCAVKPSEMCLRGWRSFSSPLNHNSVESRCMRAAFFMSPTHQSRSNSHWMPNGGVAL